jgi:tight adherence protein C
MIIYLIPILTALTLITAIAGIYQIQARSRRVSARLQRVVDGEGRQVTTGDGLVDETLPFGLKIITFFAWLMPGHIYSEHLKWDLAQAGYRHLEARKVFGGTRVLTTTLFGLGAVLATWALKLQPQEILVLTLAGAALGFYLPVMAVRIRQTKRQFEITLSLPDALDLLVICVEAGQGLNAAILKVANESEFQSKALSEELKMVNNEMRAGITRTQALRNLALRTGVDDVRSLVAVMIQSDRFGTSIAQALRIHAESLRTRRRQRAEETARKAPVKLVFPLVFCIFPELLVVILAPGMLELFRALSRMNSGG